MKETIAKLSDKDVKDIIEWEKDHSCSIEYARAISGKITYCITPTSLGSICVTKCTCGAEKDWTNYDKW